MMDSLIAGEGKQGMGSGGQSRPGRRDHGRGCDLPARQAQKKTPHPLRASLSLRNSWLLPEFWKHDRLHSGGVRQAGSGQRQQKRKDAADRQRDGHPGRPKAPTPSHLVVVRARHTAHRIPRAPRHYFFFGLALLLAEDFGLAGGLAFLPDLHPHALHILAPFQNDLGSA
jgi:hypothetical protein